MRTLATTAFLALTLGIAGCADQPSPAAQSSTPAQPAGVNTGQMAYPTPRASGEFQRAAPTGFDTGSMAVPSVSRPGTTTNAVQGPADTGSMASPAPRPAGNIPR